jgi:hypothetical protein
MPTALVYSPEYDITFFGIDARDRLGRMSVSADAVFERDCFVLEELSRRQIPCVVVPSGGVNARELSPSGPDGRVGTGAAGGNVVSGGIGRVAATGRGT